MRRPINPEEPNADGEAPTKLMRNWRGRDDSTAAIHDCQDSNKFWAFAVRVWLAIVLALFVSFWLQLDAPFAAAVTVAILAEPTRG